MLYILLLLPFWGIAQPGLQATPPLAPRTPLQWKLNLLSPLSGGMGAGLEVPVTQHFNLTVNGELGRQRVALWEGLEGNYSGLKAIAEGRFYPFRSAEHLSPTSFHGPYAGAWVRYKKANVEAHLPEGDYNMLKGQSYSAGLMLGWQFNFLRKYPGFLLDISVGTGYSSSTTDGKLNEKGRSILFEHTGFVPRLAFTAGICLNGGNAAKAAASGKPERKVPNKTSPDPKNRTDKVANAAIAYYRRYSKQQILRIEEQLRRIGLNPGDVDGIADEKTVKAVMRFQKHTGLAADGRAGAKTLKKLGLPSLK